MVKIGELYLHSKGDLVKVIDIVVSHNSLEFMIVYEKLGGNGQLKSGQRFVISLKEFENFENKSKRFKRIGELVDEGAKVKVKVKKLNKDAMVPSYAHSGDAGMDLYSIDNCVIKAGERKLIHTGISMELSEGYFASIRGKSGLAFKKGIDILAGVIEYTYRGEYGVVALNTGDDDFEVKKGDKVAQVLIQPIAVADVDEVGELSDTTRGEGGFGSTGSR